MAKISADIVIFVIFVSTAAVYVQGGKKKYSTRSSETRAREVLNMDEMKGLSLTDWVGMAAQNIEFYANRLGVMAHDDPSMRAAMIYTHLHGESVELPPPHSPTSDEETDESLPPKKKTIPPKKKVKVSSKPEKGSSTGPLTEIDMQVNRIPPLPSTELTDIPMMISNQLTSILPQIVEAVKASLPQNNNQQQQQQQ